MAKDLPAEEIRQAILLLSDDPTRCCMPHAATVQTLSNATSISLTLSNPIVIEVSEPWR